MKKEEDIQDVERAMYGYKSCYQDETLPENEKMQPSITPDNQHTWWSLLRGSVCLVVAGGVLVVSLVSLVVHLTVVGPSQSQKGAELQRTCLKCSTLDELIDRWSWQDDVNEDESTGECCINGDLKLAKTLKYYFEKRLSGNRDDVHLLDQRVDDLDHLVWDILRNRTQNLTIPSVPNRDIVKLIDLIQEVFHKERAVLHLTSQRTVFEDEPRVLWQEEVKQGTISLAEDKISVQITATGLYHISTQVKFRSMLPRNETRNTTIQFYLVRVKAGPMSRVDDYKKAYVFHDKMTEHDAVLHTITRLERGENLVLRFPTSQKQYLASEHGSHRLSIFELS